jgi:hypothetical protein
MSTDIVLANPRTYLLPIQLIGVKNEIVFRGIPQILVNYPTW